MADAERVVFALVAPRERRKAALLLDRADAVAAAGEDFVRVALVPDVPDQAIGWRIEQVVQGDRQLDDAQSGAEMAAGAGNGFDQVLAQLTRNVRQFALYERAQVRRAFDAGEERIALGVDHGGKGVTQTAILCVAAIRGKDTRDCGVCRGALRALSGVGCHYLTR